MKDKANDFNGVRIARRELLKFSGAAAVMAASVTMPFKAFAQKAGVLRVGLNARDMGLLHPHVATASQDTPIINSIFSGLLSFQAPHVSYEAIQPDLAESWEASADHKTYTFRLRKDVKWHKGYGEVTSEDVKYSLDWVRNNPRSTFRPLYANIDNVDPTDRYTVTVALKEADPVFAASVANWQGGYIICKKAAEELGDKYKSQPIGSGPFQFESYRPKESVTLSANPDYYRGKPKLNRVIYSYIPDDTSRRFAFVQQQIDMMQGQPNEDWLSEIEKAMSGKKPVVDLLGPTRMVSIHMKKSVKPLDNPMVRAAIAHAINRDDYVQFFGRVFIPTFSPTPKDYAGTLPAEKIPAEQHYGFDLDKAKKLLASAGYSNGFQLETIISERTDYLNLAQIAQEQLAKIGIKLKLDVVDQSTYVSGIIKKNKGSLVWSTSSRFPSANTLLREFWLCASDVTKPTGVQNFSLYCNRDFDAAYQAGVEASDPAVRAKYFEQAELLLLKDLPSLTIGGLATAALRQHYVDLGYPVAKGENILSLPYMYHLNEKTNV